MACIVLVQLFFTQHLQAQLTVTTGASASTLAATLAGPGATTYGATLTCPGIAEGTFTATGTLLSMSSGIVLTNGHAAATAGTEPALTSYNDGAAGDASFVTLGILPSGTNTYDACELEFNVVATGDTLSFNYQFGSDEYRTAVCSPYNDAFAFFISGPGIVGSPNMALVPGTNLPVEINTVNNGIPGTSGGVLSNCTSIGAGSPFTAYYLDNTGGTLLAYRGYTTKFKAFHTVTPCDTYHLKLAIVDAGNAIYDSGVFLEAGSLHSNSLHFNHSVAVGATIDGIPNSIVKGCSDATISIISTPSSGTPTTITLTYGGTGVSGTDFTSPGSVIIPAGDTTVTFTLTGLPTPPAGAKTVTIYLSGGCGLTDSIKLNLLDTPSAYILTPDTSVCGSSVLIRTTGSAGLVYAWAPPAGLSSTTAAEPTATPTATTTYTLTATLPGSGCPPITRDVTITVGAVSLAMLTPDTSICAGTSFDIRVTGTAGLSYLWSPGTGLSSTTLQDPTASPTVTTTYTVVATLSGSGCGAAIQYVTVTVNNISDSILTQDTTVCTGTTFTIRTIGTTGLAYNWTPGTGLSSTTVANPTVTPLGTMAYTLTATIPGCPTVVSDLEITVDTLTLSIVTPNTQICLGGSVNFLVSSSGATSYSWTPSSSLSNATIPDPVATPTMTTTYTLSVASAGSVCPVISQEVTITVGNFTDSIYTPDTTVCLGSSFQIVTSGTPGITYSWTPAAGLSNVAIAEPVATPMTTTTYVLTTSLPGSGCPPQTRSITVAVQHLSLTMPTPDTSVCMGAQVTLSTIANAAYTFSWSPAVGLNNPAIQNPVAMPGATTTYIVTADSPGSVCPPVTGTETITILTPFSAQSIADSTPCSKGKIQLEALPGGAYSYWWYGPSGFSTTAQNPSIDSPGMANQGYYYLVVTDNTTGCKALDSVWVNLAQDIAEELTNITTAQTIKLGQSVHLNADSAQYYYWYPNDGTLSNANVNDPVATPVVPTTYYVVGINQYGCRDTDSVHIEVIYDQIFIPTAFSPNKDGLNDRFRIGNLGYFTLVQMCIFDRYGELVYEDLSGANTGWDGTFKGQTMDMGTFYYYIIIRRPDEKQVTYKGDITLLR